LRGFWQPNLSLKVRLQQKSLSFRTGFAQTTSKPYGSSSAASNSPLFLGFGLVDKAVAAATFALDRKIELLALLT
jgi:hypothetical protein